MKRCPSSVPSFVSRSEALRIVLEHARKLGAVRCALDDACGRTLARGVRAPIDLPPFRRALMDGFAIAKGDRGREFVVAGELRAGAAPKGRMRRGEAIRVMTGAMLPLNAGRVAVKERVEQLGADRVRIARDDRAAHIAERGAFLRKGAALASAGERVTPALAATIATAGVGEVRAVRAPRVGLLLTGDEFARAGRRAAQGKIYEGNGTLLRGLLGSWGVGEVEEERAGDSLPALARTLRRLLARCDAVITVGGISAGEYDLVPEALAACGAGLRLRKVAIQPGKPFSFATRGRVPIFALPGNPASVFVTAHLFLKPALARMTGMREASTSVERRLRGSFERSDAARELFLPVRMRGERDVELVPYQGSGDLPAIARASGLMIVPAGAWKVRPGKPVQVLVLSRP
jgi:molybdopterin molybdotransferase